MVKNKNKNWQSFILLALYVVMIHILCLRFFDTAYSDSYRGLLFFKSFSRGKYVLCLFETAVAIFFTLKHLRRNTLTDKILVFLCYLYFIPGFVQQAATDSDWGYMLFYFVYFLGLEFWGKVLKPHTHSNLYALVPVKSKNRYLTVLTIVCLFVTTLILVYNRTSFSISSLIETLADVYGVRADAKLAGTHWLILNFEYWSIYLIVLLVAFYSERRNWWLTLMLLIFGISLFLIQANRIFIFLLLAALGMGFFHLTPKKLQLIFCVISVLLLVELMIADGGLVLTNIFRRYSVVPNRLAEFYFDYFQNEEPDWLRSVFSRVARMLGIVSPYENNPIGNIIGNTYLGWDINCNTGLVGGGLFCYGLASFVLSSFSYIMAFRLFEGSVSGVAQTQIPYALSFMLASLAVNAPAFLANMLSVTYFLFLYLSLVPLSARRKRSTQSHRLLSAVGK